jgi:[acyl-carrier-protein] S-malonyltransferase
MPLAILCSGQGNQHAGMFDLTADSPAAAELFRVASDLLGGRDPRQLVQAGRAADLEEDRTAQVLCVLAALSLGAALADALPGDRLVAGYSVGELAAWGLANVFDGIETLRLAAARAEVMDVVRDGPQGLLFARGLSRCAIDELCRRTRTFIAIINPGDAYLVGGSERALDDLEIACRTAGATRSHHIGVHIASHTPLLAKASAEFDKRLGEIKVVHPLRHGVRLFSGVDGQPVFDLVDGLRKLSRQISTTVDWVACLQGCAEAGATSFLELGPGHALSVMAAEVAPGVETHAAEDFKSLKGLKSWLGQHR